MCFNDINILHCFLNSYRAHVHDADTRGVCLLTALYHCVTDHTSEGSMGNKGEHSVGLVDLQRSFPI